MSRLPLILPRRDISLLILLLLALSACSDSSDPTPIAPVAVNDSFTVPADSGQIPLDVLGNDFDPGGASLSIVAVGTANQGGSVTINGTADRLVYAPAAGYSGNESFGYTISNGQQTAIATVTVVVSAPVSPVAVDDAFTVVTGSIDVALDVLANDHDPDDAPMIIVAVGTPDQGGSVSINAGIGLVYSPSSGFIGSEIFDYTISNGHGTHSATVTITVIPPGTPVAVDDAFSIPEDSVDIPLDVLANDQDPDSDPLTIVAVGTPGQGGSISINSTGDALIYSPAPDYFGTETFSYTISDGQTTATATVTITVTPVNDPPVAVNDAFSIPEDSVDVPLDVLANDHDPDNGPLTVVAVNTPSHGGNVIINPAGDALVYSPAPDFFGFETFGYTISNGQQNASATVTVEVTPVNDPPVAANDAFTVSMNSSDVVLSVLGNDSEPDGDPLSIITVGTPDKGGIVSINQNGDALIYRPLNNVVGLETFSYTISDGVSPVTATVSVNVRFTDDFSSGSGNWTMVDDSGRSSSWVIIGNALRQQNRVESITAFDLSYHKGTYAYFTTGTALTDYRFTVDAIYLSTGLADDIGIMFRYQNNNNYYRLTMNARYGFTRLEKKVSGNFIPLAVNSRGYAFGQLLSLTAEVSGSLIRVWINGDPVFAVNDASLASGTVALYTQDRSSFDNVVIEAPTATPAVVLAAPVAYAVVTGQTLAASAIATQVPTGGAVEFLLDGIDSAIDATFPYTANFPNLLPGDHSIEAIVRDAANEEVARDTNVMVGTQGEYFITFGDSVVNGSGDNYSADNSSQSGRVIAAQGLQANLTDLLDASLLRPVIVYNEAIGGDETFDAAFTRATSILARHPGSNIALVLLGTNDTLAGIPSGQGCNGAACNGTFKGNMQALINTLTGAGKTVYVARTPPVFGLSTPFANPESHATNLRVQAYNNVIVNELSGRQVGPDFYGYFLGSANRFSLFADIWHPNALGQAVMAHLWHNVLNPGAPVALPLVLEGMTRTTVAPYLKQNLLEIGDAYYADRTYTLNSIPAVLADGVWIMTANEDVNGATSDYVSFTVDRPVRVYIAYDGGADARPNWMNTYIDTGLEVGTTDPLSPTLRVYSRTFAAGPITLGGNLATGASGSNSHYSVVILPD